MNSEVTNYPLLEIFLVSLVVILGSSEIGHRLGLRAAIKGGDNIATLEGAILGLMALMISFPRPDTPVTVAARPKTRTGGAVAGSAPTTDWRVAKSSASSPA